MDVEVYTFEDADGVESGWHTMDAQEARDYARERGLKWIANRFEFTDSELVEDNTRADADED